MKCGSYPKLHHSQTLIDGNFKYLFLISLNSHFDEVFDSHLVQSFASLQMGKMRDKCKGSSPFFRWFFSFGWSSPGSGIFSTPCVTSPFRTMLVGEIGPAVTNSDIWTMHGLEGNLNLTRSFVYYNIHVIFIQISFFKASVTHVSCLLSFPTLRSAFLDLLSVKDELEKACTVLVTDKRDTHLRYIDRHWKTMRRHRIQIIYSLQWYIQSFETRNDMGGSTKISSR